MGEQAIDVTGGLSGGVRVGDVHVVTAVVKDPSGRCEALQVLVADTSARAAVRRLRLAGYRGVQPALGSMRPTAEDVELAMSDVGQIFEREWLSTDLWRATPGHSS